MGTAAIAAQLCVIKPVQLNKKRMRVVFCTYISLHVNCICMWFNVSALNMHTFTQFFSFFVLDSWALFLFPSTVKKSVTTATTTRTACVFYCALVYEYFKFRMDMLSLMMMLSSYLLHGARMRVFVSTTAVYLRSKNASRGKTEKIVKIRYHQWSSMGLTNAYKIRVLFSHSFLVAFFTF